MTGGPVEGKYLSINALGGGGGGGGRKFPGSRGRKFPKSGGPEGAIFLKQTLQGGEKSF